MSDLSNTDHEGMSYEEALSELERIVSTLESEERPLEEALALFERGQSLARYCADLLDKAELKVQQLSGEELNEFQP
jgi:exodeoxyribonuclease VII small subunit